MLAKAKNGHTNIWYILLLNFVATYNIRSPTQDSEKEIVLCKKGDDNTRFDIQLNTHILILHSHNLLRILPPDDEWGAED